MDDRNLIISLDKRIEEASIRRKKVFKVSFFNRNIFKYSTDFIAVILLAFFLGNFLDKTFNSKPLFFIICIIMGCAGIFRNVWYETIEKKNV